LTNIACIPPQVVYALDPMAARTPPTPASRTKLCSCCGQTFPVTGFGRNRQSKDGLHYYCKACAAKRQREWAQANPEVVKRMRSNYLERIYAQNEGKDPYE